MEHLRPYHILNLKFDVKIKKRAVGTRLHVLDEALCNPSIDQLFEILQSPNEASII